MQKEADCLYMTCKILLDHSYAKIDECNIFSYSESLVHANTIVHLIGCCMCPRGSKWKNNEEPKTDL